MQPEEFRVSNIESKNKAVQACQILSKQQALDERGPARVSSETDLNTFLFPTDLSEALTSSLDEVCEKTNYERTAAILKDIPFFLGVNLSAVHFYSKPAGKISVLVMLNRSELNNSSAWKRIAKLSEELKLPVKVIGRASNMMFGEEDIPGILVQYQYSQAKQKIRFEDQQITADAGLSLPYLVREAVTKGWDLSFLAGIPGTLGGACIGNAGQTKTYENIGNLIKAVQIFDLETGQTEWLDPADKRWKGSFFVQRGSVLKQLNLPSTRKVVLKLLLKPEQIGKREALARLKLSMNERFDKNKEAINERTAGSFWANGIAPESLLRDKSLVRDLLIEAGVAALSICGARYTEKYRFLSTTTETRDHHVALLMKITRRAFEKIWGFVPYREVDIYTSHGSVSDEEFIAETLNTTERVL